MTVRAIAKDEQAADEPAASRLTEAENAELKEAFAVVAQTRAGADTALGAMRDAEAVANYLMRRICARYGLAEGDRIEDDGAITRVSVAAGVEG